MRQTQAGKLKEGMTLVSTNGTRWAVRGIRRIRKAAGAMVVAEVRATAGELTVEQLVEFTENQTVVVA